MDPNATLHEMRRLARTILNDSGEDVDSSEADRLAELFEALDDWITRGGFLPKGWERLSMKTKARKPLPNEQELYRNARAEAQAKANELGFDFGVERNIFGFSVFMLPRKENRCGHELRCEVVSCENLSKCQPGHGPMKGGT